MDAVAGKNPEILVSLEGAGARQSGHWLVRGVDLSVRRGEIVTLIGPNGSGKTTSAKLAIGLIRPSEGKVKRADNLTIGYVPQILAIDRTLPLTVARLMALGGRQKAAAVEEALEAVGIAELADVQVQHLSGGEFQRALFARALIRKPDILVLDEPVQGVDFTGELALYDLIQTIRADLGCGILLISHDLHVVMAQTDTVVCLNGHVCCTGSPEAVASNPEYEKLFGRRAVDALAVYRHHHDHVHLPDGRIRHDDGSITQAEAAAHQHHEDPGAGGGQGHA
ncbi:MAG: metal ABC transporter ATP-binding protein [Rhizobiales bacterium]|nr:metal ABC transporter ATP-binding protein [Hyphomicrobiales bacterium]